MEAKPGYLAHLATTNESEAVTLWMISQRLKLEHEESGYIAGGMRCVDREDWQYVAFVVYMPCSMAAIRRLLHSSLAMTRNNCVLLTLVKMSKRMAKDLVAETRRTVIRMLSSRSANQTCIRIANRRSHRGISFMLAILTPIFQRVKKGQSAVSSPAPV